MGGFGLGGGGWEGFNRGSMGEDHAACVMLVQSRGIMLAVWMMTWAVSSCRRRISILEWCVPNISGK